MRKGWITNQSGNLFHNIVKCMVKATPLLVSVLNIWHEKSVTQNRISIHNQLKEQIISPGRIRTLRNGHFRVSESVVRGGVRKVKNVQLRRCFIMREILIFLIFFCSESESLFLLFVVVGGFQAIHSFLLGFWLLLMAIHLGLVARNSIQNWTWMVTGEKKSR